MGSSLSAAVHSVLGYGVWVLVSLWWRMGSGLSAAVRSALFVVYEFWSLCKRVCIQIALQHVCSVFQFLWQHLKVSAWAYAVSKSPELQAFI